ncbi:hypothetical protein ACFQ0G_08740 [Streptomyces chiangmaiensis]
MSGWLRLRSDGVMHAGEATRIRSSIRLRRQKRRHVVDALRSLFRNSGTCSALHAREAISKSPLHALDRRRFLALASGTFGFLAAGQLTKALSAPAAELDPAPSR